MGVRLASIMSKHKTRLSSANRRLNARMDLMHWPALNSGGGREAYLQLVIGSKARLIS